MVRGRDIRRYRAKWANLWLIDTHNGYSDTPAINIDDFPAVKAHLDGYFPRLAKRYDKGTTPYNLRNCAYHADFAKEKLLWMDMAPEGRFTYSDEEMYCNNKGFMMTGGPLKYLCAVLNSTLITWMMRNTARTTGMGLLQWEKFAVERLPVPNVSVKRQQPLIEQVDQILSAKSNDLAANTRREEAEIDRLVFRLYGLNDDEVRTVS